MWFLIRPRQRAVRKMPKEESHSFVFYLFKSLWEGLQHHIYTLVALVAIFLWRIIMPFMWGHITYLIIVAAVVIFLVAAYYLLSKRGA